MKTLNKARAPNRRLRFPLGSLAAFVYHVCAPAASQAAAGELYVGQRAGFEIMSNASRDWVESFGGWSLTFGLGYYLLSHLSEPLAIPVDLTFVAGGILLLSVAAFRRRRCRKMDTPDAAS